MDFLNKKIELKIKDKDKLNKQLSYKAKQSTKYLDQEQEGYIIPEEGEETNKMNQEFLKSFLPEYNKSNIFDLNLPHGPFSIDFSSNGLSLLLSSRKAVSVLDWKNKDITAEVELEKDEKIFESKFINGDRMFALSQRERLMIYDNQGIEIHSLDAFAHPRFLQDLPYHFLLACSLKNK